ncbi:MAG: hypothetical protein C5B60_06880 [Chloroflexi bacterium]|nr:MAG: hypothetical protein C5B60_06880 [Chloroflexota bacterium]
MNFTAIPSQKRMNIGNAVLVFDSSSFLDPNVEIVAWDGDAGSGFFEYNDRARMLEPFTDLSTYREMIDAWIDTAATAPIWVDRSSPPDALNVTQARQIKLDMVDDLYFVKRTTPYTWGLFDFETTDEAVSYMAAAAAAGNTGGGQTFLVAIIDIANANVGVYNSNLVACRRMRDNNWAPNAFRIDENLGWRVMGLGGPHGHPEGAHGVPPGHGDHWYDSVVWVTDRMHDVVIGNQQQLGGGHLLSAINWQPVNVNNQVPFSARDFRDVLRAIVNRRTRLAGHRGYLRARLAECSTVQQIIDLDVTWTGPGGWPS